MKNIFTHIFKYGIYSLLLFAVVSIASSSANGQAAMTPTFPEAGNKIPGSSDQVSFTATGYENGTTFFLYQGTFSKLNVLASTQVVGNTSTVTAETLNFEWPETGLVTLSLQAFSGDAFSEDVTPVNIAASSLFKVGVDLMTPNYPLSVSRSGSRYVETQNFDLDVSERVRLVTSLNDNNDIDKDHALVVQYSTNDGSTYTNLTLDAVTVGGNTPAVDDAELYGFDGAGEFSFDLPAGAKTAATKFRIFQMDAGSLDQDSRTWTVNSIGYTVGNTYDVADAAQSTAAYTIQNPTLQIDDVLAGTTTIAGGNVYPEDEITVKATLVDVVDLNIYKYVVVLEDGDDKYLLTTSVDPVVNSGSSTISITGTVPLDAAYKNLKVKVYAYPVADAKIIFGVLEDINFTVAGILDTFVENGAANIGGEEEIGSGLLFTESGARSVTTPTANIESADGVLEIKLARANDLVSPSGTGIKIEFSSDGNTFTEIETKELNELKARNAGYTLISYKGEDWPAGVVSGSTQFRVSQVSNNGIDLDAWYLVSLKLSNSTNIPTIVDYTESNVTVNRPELTMTPLDIAPDNLSYPMTALTLSYTQGKGTFPDNTSATLLLDRVGMDEEFDIVLGEIANVTTGSIDFKVPPLEPGDYKAYVWANEERYADVNLPIYGINISIDETTFSNSVTIAGEDFAFPGSEINVEYTITGTPGDGAELMLSIYDEDLNTVNMGGTTNHDNFVLLSATTTLDGKISAIIPSGMNFGASPTIQLSIGSGIYDQVFSTQYTENWFNDDVLPAGFTAEGGGAYGGKKFALVSNGTRSLTSKPFDIPLGGTVRFNFSVLKYDFAQDYKIEASANGVTWEELGEEAIPAVINNYAGVTYTIP